jgi:hypothetical protein
MKRLLLACLLGLGACGGAQECPAIGCGPPLVVEFAEQEPSGTYDLRIDGDGQTWTCTLVLGETSTSSTCDFWVVGASGSGFSQVQLEATPVHVRFRMSHDGAAVIDEAFDPVYRPTRVNDCLECSRADVKL